MAWGAEGAARVPFCSVALRSLVAPHAKKKKKIRGRRVPLGAIYRDPLSVKRAIDFIFHSCLPKWTRKRFRSFNKMLAVALVTALSQSSGHVFRDEQRHELDVKSAKDGKISTYTFFWP